MKKRILSLLLSLIMVLSLLPTTAWADRVDHNQGGNQGGGGLQPSEKYYKPTDFFGYDSWTSGGSLTGLVSVKVGTTTLTKGTGSSTTGAAYSNGITVTLEAGYYISDYKYVCGDKYNCQTDGAGHVANGGVVRPGESASSITLTPTKADLGHSSGKTPYWLLLKLAQDTTQYHVTYDWGELTGKLATSVPVDANGYLVNAVVTVKAPGTDATNEATGLGYVFTGWKADFNGETYQPDGKFGMPQKNVTLVAQWEPVPTGNLTITKVLAGNGASAAASKTFTFTVKNAEGTLVTTKQITGAGSVTVDGLTPGTYTVTESGADITGYTLSATGNGVVTATVEAGKTVTANITNTYTRNTKNVTVEKVWANTDGITLPDSIKVQLMANGVNYGDPVELNTTNNWKYTFNGLNTHDDSGKEITYTAKEVSVPDGFTSSASGLTITNTAKRGTDINTSASLTITKVDSANTSKKLAGATFTLTKDGKTVATKITDVSGVATFDNLTEGTYTLTETKAPTGYDLDSTPRTITVVKDSGTTALGTDGQYHTTYKHSVQDNSTIGLSSGAMTVKNTRSTTTVTVTKSWDDQNNKYGLRPASVTVSLMNGNTVVGTAALTADNSWTYTFNGLNTHDDDGNEIAYTVKETAVAHYTSAVTDSAANGYIVTNTLKTGSLTINKTFSADIGENERPASVKFSVVSSSYSTEVTLNADNRWTTTLTLPYGDYTVTETDNGTIDHYTWSHVKYSYKDANGDNIEGTNGSVTIHLTENNTTSTINAKNVYKADTISVTVTKNWVHSGVPSDKQPAEVKVQLYADGKTGNWIPVALNAANNWTYTFTNLRKYDTTGKEIVYTVGETAVPTGYVASQPGNANNNYTITNTADWDEEIVNKASVTVTKYDGSGKNVLAGAKFTLTSSDDTVVATATTGTDGTCKFENLVAGTYTLTETEAPEGYTKSDKTVEITVQADSETVINDSGKFQTTTTYTATPDAATFNNENVTESIPVEKKWVNADGITLPVSVTVELYKNGSPTGNSVALTRSNNWTTTFADLPTHDGNTENVYTVKEVGYQAEDGYHNGVPAGFVSEDGNADNGYTITNTAQRGEDKVNPASLTIKKVDGEGNALADAVFTLYEYDRAIDTATSDANGIVTFNNLKAGHGYVLSETSAPDGYKRIFGTWQVYVAKNPKPTETGKLVDGKFYNVYDCTVTVSKEQLPVTPNNDGSFTITNELAPTTYKATVDIEKTVKKTGGNMTPGQEEFIFLAYYKDTEKNVNVGEVRIITNGVDANGEKTYPAAEMELTVPASAFDLDANGNGTVTLSVSEVKGSAAGWTYDETVYTLIMTVKNYEVAGITSGDTVEIIPNGDSVPDSQLPEIAPTVETLTFTNEFSQTKTPNRPNKPSKPITSVKTGDAGVAMYAMSGLLSLGGAALFMKKRKDEE